MMNTVKEFDFYSEFSLGKTMQKSCQSFDAEFTVALCEAICVSAYVLYRAKSDTCFEKALPMKRVCDLWNAHPAINKELQEASLFYVYTKRFKGNDKFYTIDPDMHINNTASSNHSCELPFSNSSLLISNDVLLVFLREPIYSKDDVSGYLYTVGGNFFMYSDCYKDDMDLAKSATYQLASLPSIHSDLWNSLMYHKQMM